MQPSPLLSDVYRPPLDCAVLSVSAPGWPRSPAYLPLVQSLLSVLYAHGRARRTWLDQCRGPR